MVPEPDLHRRRIPSARRHTQFQEENMSPGPRAFRILMVLLVAALLSLPAAAGAQTVNGIKTPSDGSTVGGIVDVAGYADTVGFAKWQLDLLPNGNPDLPIWLAIGTKP